MNHYLQENVLTRPFALINQKYPFHVACPCPLCEECLDVIDMWVELEASVKLRYANLIAEFVYRDVGIRCSEVARKANQICKEIHNDALTLKCQSCFVPVDPSADGCSAVQCMSCGVHFCGCCLQSGFDKSDAARDRAEAHRHAATHHPSTDPSERNAFLPADIVCSGNQRFKRERVASVLRGYVDACESVRDIQSLENVLSIVLICCSTELQEVGVDIPVMWQLIRPRSYNRQLVRTELSAALASSPDTIRIASETEDVVGGRILSNALLANNSEAARQILCSVSAEHLDVDFFEPIHGHPLLTLSLLTGDLVSAARLVELGANPLLTNRDGRNAIYISIETANWSIAQKIFGANPSIGVDSVCTTEFAFYTALHVAVRYNNVEAVNGLLNCGADVNIKEFEYGYTPLALAVALRNDCMYALLKDNRTSLYAEHNPEGRTALFIMCEFGLTDMLSILLNTRSDFDINKPVMRSGECLLHVAARYRQPFFVQLLLANSSLDHLNLSIEGKTPLIWSILTGCEPTACQLLVAGAILDGFDEKSLLHLAAEFGMTRFLQLLFQMHSFVKTQASIDMCLEIAVAYAQYDAVDFFLSISADSRICGALKIASTRGDCWAVQQLLLRNRESVLGESAILAVRHGRNNVIRLLIEQFGYDPNEVVRVSDSEVITMLDAARACKLPRTVELLIELGART